MLNFKLTDDPLMVVEIETMTLYSVESSRYLAWLDLGGLPGVLTDEERWQLNDKLRREAYLASLRFKLTRSSSTVKKIGVNEFHSATDSQEYLDWLALGNTPEPDDPPTPEELAEVKFRQDATEAKAYQKLKALSEMSPAQVATWVEANVTNLNQAQDAIKTLAIGMSVLIRRL